VCLIPQKRSCKALHTVCKSCDLPLNSVADGTPCINKKSLAAGLASSLPNCQIENWSGREPTNRSNMWRGTILRRNAIAPVLAGAFWR
jgi:hypothetical protein